MSCSRIKGYYEKEPALKRWLNLHTLNLENDLGQVCNEGPWVYDASTGRATCQRSICGVWVADAVPEVATQKADPQAFKADAGKPRFELLMDGMPNALLDVVKVLTWAVQAKKDAPWPEGGKGYVPHSWRDVPEAKRRYRAALQRHENAIARGEVNDPESGLPHRAHVATNAMFLAELDHLYPETTNAKAR